MDARSLSIKLINDEALSTADFIPEMIFEEDG
jgi:hypothetical protein